MLSLPNLSSLTFHSTSHRHFLFTDPATTEIYTLSLHDALPIYPDGDGFMNELTRADVTAVTLFQATMAVPGRVTRSEEHTSELQSRQYLVCRLLLEKKKQASSRSPCSPAPPSGDLMPVDLCGRV